MAYKDKQNQKDYIKSPKYKQYYREYCSRPDVKKNRRDYMLKLRYGISLEQHRQMFVSQDGKCAICKKLFTDKNQIKTDHDHATGKVRQLLCHSCNCVLGYAKDNIDTLLKAAEYLRKWKE